VDPTRSIDGELLTVKVRVRVKGNSSDKLHHPRSEAYSSEQVTLHLM